MSSDKVKDNLSRKTPYSSKKYIIGFGLERSISKVTVVIPGIKIESKFYLHCSFTLYFTNVFIMTMSYFMNQKKKKKKETLASFFMSSLFRVTINTTLKNYSPCLLSPSLHKS